MARHRARRPSRLRRMGRALAWPVTAPVCASLRLVRATLAMVGGLLWVSLCALLLLASLTSRTHGAVLRTFVIGDMLRPLLDALHRPAEEPSEEPSEEAPGEGEGGPSPRPLVDPDPALWPTTSATWGHEAADAEETLLPEVSSWGMRALQELNRRAACATSQE